MDIDVIYNESCIEVLKRLEDNSIDAIVTDPPYNLGFMGKGWDRTGIAFSLELWKECLRVIKPGGNLLSFGGARTYHRMVCAIEDAGFEIRDCIMWVYSTGFPKSLNISKQLQKKSLCGIKEVDEETSHNTTGIESKASRAKGEKQTPKYCLRLMPEADLQKGVYTKEEPGEVLQPSLSQQGISQSRQSADYDREGQSSVEGWCNIQASQRELQRCQICQMSERISDNGEERWLCYGTPLGYGTAYWSPTPQNRDCPSYRPQPSEQPNRQSNAIPYKQSSQELRRAIELWEGYGTGLKPAVELICLARKPISEKTIAENCLKWGVGGLNIDATRIPYQSAYDKSQAIPQGRITTKDGHSGVGAVVGGVNNFEIDREQWQSQMKGRFPANFIHDGSQEVMELFPETRTGGRICKTDCGNSIFGKRKVNTIMNNNDSGSAARFFYCAKASKKERNSDTGSNTYNRRCLKCGKWQRKQKFTDIYTCHCPEPELEQPTSNNHPTIKPLALMEYLIKLVTRPGHIVLDPFIGSGTTAMACVKLGRHYIGCELDRGYYDIVIKRIGL